MASKLDDYFSKASPEEKAEIEKIKSVGEREGIKGENTSNAPLHQTPKDRTSYVDSHPSYKPTAELKTNTSSLQTHTSNQQKSDFTQVKKDSLTKYQSSTSSTKSAGSNQQSTSKPKAPENNR